MKSGQDTTDSSENPKLKLGLVLVKSELRAWNYSIIEKILSEGHGEISFVLFVNEDFKTTSRVATLRNVISDSIEKLDEFLFRRWCELDALSECRYEDLQLAIPEITATPMKCPDNTCFSDSIVDEVKKLNLDVLVNLSSATYTGNIYQAATHGIWSLDSGDESKLSLNQKIFWQFFLKKTETCNLLEKSESATEPRMIIDASWSAVQSISPTVNKHHVLWNLAALVPRQVRRLRINGSASFHHEARQHSTSLACRAESSFHKPNSVIAIFLYLLSLIATMKAVFRERYFWIQWQIGFSLGSGIETNLVRYQPLAVPDDESWADPWIIERDEKFYIFFERMKKSSSRGTLSVIEMDAAGQNSAPRSVMEKNYHLSYPSLIEANGTLYMLPETRENRTIELHECLEFPGRWVFKMNLMRDIEAVDTTLYFHLGKWWMFSVLVSGKGRDSCEDLHLFFCKDLLSDNWVSHPLNPIVSDVRVARSAGGVFEHDGKLIRPSQDCSKRYGFSINFNEIVELSETTYSEKSISRIMPELNSSILGTHTFNRSKGISVIDFYRSKRI